MGLTELQGGMARASGSYMASMKHAIGEARGAGTKGKMGVLCCVETEPGATVQDLDEVQDRNNEGAHV